MTEFDRYWKDIKYHEERVANLAAYLAGQLGLSPEEILKIYVAGRNHDYGKLIIPNDILNKKGKLTEEEFELIKKHPETGHDLLRRISYDNDISKIVLHHHESSDGNGYPSGLVGESIPVGARVIHICDVFDALREARPYRPKLSIEEAIQIMDKEANENKYDGNIYDVFRRLV